MLRKIQFSLLLVCSLLNCPSLAVASTTVTPTSEPGCQAIDTANLNLWSLPGFRGVLDIEFPERTQQEEFISVSHVVYSRILPSGPWRTHPLVLNPNPDGTPIHSNCHTVGEEMVDGVRTMVISFDGVVKNQPKRLCKLWLEIPKLLLHQRECKSTATDAPVRSVMSGYILLTSPRLQTLLADRLRNLDCCEQSGNNA